MNLLMLNRKKRGALGDSVPQSTPAYPHRLPRRFHRGDDLLRQPLNGLLLLRGDGLAHFGNQIGSLVDEHQIGRHGQ